MEERQQEIKVHSDVLKAQLKAAEEERHATAKGLSEKLLKVEKLTNKYDIICGKMGADGDGDGDGEHTQAYYVIKAAQEREELQRQGDELDQKIQKAEREIRALEKTLQHLFAKNAGYKRTFQPVDKGSAQFEQKVILEEQHRAALSKYRAHRLEQSELEQEIARSQQTMAEQGEQLEATQGKLAEQAELQSQLQEHIAQQGAEIERKKAETQLLLNTHRAAAQVPEGEQTVLELEAELIKRQSENNAVLAGLMRVAASDAQLQAELETKLTEAGIQPPGPDEEEDDGGEGGEDFLE